MNKKLLVNIRGCNGSGKSTIPLSMMDDPQMYTVDKKFQGKLKTILTVFPTYGWVALGSYSNQTGGLDRFSNTKLTSKALQYALSHFGQYHVLMEGVIASTVRSTYIDLFHQVEAEHPERKVVVISFLPPFDVCIQRVYQRNGGKPIKEDAVYNKWRIVERNVKKFKEAGFTSLKIDNSRTAKKNMLNNFLKLVKKYEEE